MRELLVRTALQMVQDEGVEAIRVREVARRAGVSSGAPFRHFKDRNALLVAIAEEGLRQVEADTASAIEAAGQDPVAQLRAFGVSTVRLAADYPAYFRVIHEPSIEPSAEMLRLIDARNERARQMLEDAQREGALREGPPDLLLLACIATTYGLARLFVDGPPSCPIDPRAFGGFSPEAIVHAVVSLIGEGIVTPEYWETAGRDQPRFVDWVVPEPGDDGPEDPTG